MRNWQIKIFTITPVHQLTNSRQCCEAQYPPANDDRWRATPRNGRQQVVVQPHAVRPIRHRACRLAGDVRIERGGWLRRLLRLAGNGP